MMILMGGLSLNRSGSPFSASPIIVIEGLDGLSAALASLGFGFDFSANLDDSGGQL